MIFDLDKKTGPALVDTAGSSMTYEELAAHIEAVREKGLTRSVAFILADNNVESLTLFLALTEAGVVPLLMHANLDESLLDQYVRMYEPHYICRPESRAPVMGERAMVLRLGAYVMAEMEYVPYPLHEALAFLLSSSGTTGSPKLVRHCLSNMTENARHVAEVFRFSPADRSLANLPIYFTQGLNVALANLYAGALVVLSNVSLMSREFWALLTDQRITSITGVPFSYEVMVRLGLLKKEWPDLRVLNEGGGRLSDSLFRAIAEYADRTGKEFIPTYGSTETTSRMAYLPAELALEKTGSMGRPLPGGRFELVDEDGQVIPTPHREGELVYYGPNVTLGYAFDKADLAKGDERHGRYATGDIAYFDEDGCFFITGRKGRFTKIFGYRIGLDEVEKILKDHYASAFACTGNDKTVFVYTDQDLDAREVAGFLSDKLGLLSSVFHVIRIPDIPRNSYGKVLYTELKQWEM